MDVCEEAAKKQVDSGYHPDRWIPIHLEEGDKLYQLDMGSDSGLGNFFVDEETYNWYWDPETNTFDVKAYCEEAQIKPWPEDGTYKCHISEYEVGKGGLDVAYGCCENNPELGRGGCSQVYVGDDSLDELQKTHYQIVPQISDRDRTIGKRRAEEIIENHEASMRELGEEADEIAANQPDNVEGETMRNVADQAALPENAPSNGQEEGQNQERGNTMSM